MAMIRCEGSSALCEDLIDSTVDADCYVELGNMRRLHRTLVLCHACRDHLQNLIEHSVTEPLARAGMQ